MSLKEDLTVLFVSFYSKNIIEKPIGQIDREIPIIVVENSKDLKLKEHLEREQSQLIDEIDALRNRLFSLQFC